MKPHRDANELAARLGAAANKPLPLPEAQPPALTLVPTTAPAPTQAITPTPTKTARATSAKAKRAKPATDTVPTTIRPTRDLLNRYTFAAADRTRETGRVVSAQEIMLEVLERGQ